MNIAKIFVDDETITSSVDMSMPLTGLTAKLRNDNKISKPDSDFYVVYQNCPHEITSNIRVGEALTLEHLLLIISKDRYNKMKGLRGILESSIAAMNDLPTEADNIIASINHMKSFIKHYYEADGCFDKFYESMPLDLLQSESEEENLKTLTHWFKTEFFTFIHTPKCQCCNNETKGVGSSFPTLYESKGLASRTEVFKCFKCGAMIRFPRYDLPERLLETRCGRCSEFANVFTGMLLALGFDARIVVDLTDHVWSEVWLEDKQRYVHVDPCEDIIDAPYTYEVGWGKKLTWIFAIGKNEVYDVTRRYTKDYNAVVARRSAMVPEDVCAKLVNLRNQQYQSKLTQEEKNEIAHKNELDQKSMLIDRDAVKPEEQRTRISGNE